MSKVVEIEFHVSGTVTQKIELREGFLPAWLLRGFGDGSINTTIRKGGCVYYQHDGEEVGEVVEQSPLDNMEFSEFKSLSEEVREENAKQIDGMVDLIQFLHGNGITIYKGEAEIRSRIEEFITQ